MSLSDIASIGSLVGGVAVVVSLVFVGFQLRQNTQAVRAAASQSHAMNWSQITTPIAESTEFARVWRTGLADIGKLTDDETARFIAFLSGLFRLFEASRLQWRHRQLDDEHWQNIERTLLVLVNNPGILSFWKMRRNLHSTEFQTFFEAIPRTALNRGFYERPALDQ